MSYYRSMPISQLIAGLNDANMEVEAGRMSDEDMDALTDRLTAEVQMLTSLDDERHRISEEGIGQQDLVKLENISPGVTAGLNSGDYTFLASQHGLEPALNAINWKAMGKWGIIGAIIAAIIALIVKIKGGKGDKSKKGEVREREIQEGRDFILEGDKELANNIKKYITECHTKQQKVNKDKKIRELNPQEIVRVKQNIQKIYDKYDDSTLDLLVKHKTIAQIASSKGEIEYVREALVRAKINDCSLNGNLNKKIQYALELYSRKPILLNYNIQNEIKNQVLISTNILKLSQPITDKVSKLNETALTACKSESDAETWIKQAQECITSMNGVFSKYESTLEKNPIDDLRKVTLDFSGDLKPLDANFFIKPSSTMDISLAVELDQLFNASGELAQKINQLSEDLPSKGKKVSEELLKINSETSKKINTLHGQLASSFIKLVQLALKGFKGAAGLDSAVSVIGQIARSLKDFSFIVIKQTTDEAYKIF